MLKLIAKGWIIAGLLLTACGPSDGLEHARSISTSEIVSTLQSHGGMNFVIQRSFNGGATGDTLFKAWSCKTKNTDCRLQAVVDTDDGPPPKLSMDGDVVQIVLNKSDVVWDFCNVTMRGPTGKVRVSLSYT
jgi:hypothetical protein